MGNPPKTIKRIWELVSHWHTAWELFLLVSKPLLGAGGGILGALTSWLSSWPLAAWFLTIVGGIALGLFIANEIEGKRLQKRRLAAILWLEANDCHFIWRMPNGKLYEGDVNIPNGSTRVLSITLSITAYPRLYVEDINLKIMRKRIHSNWEADEIVGAVGYGIGIDFDIPNWVNAGKHQFSLVAYAGGEEWESTVQTIDVPKQLDSHKEDF